MSCADDACMAKQSDNCNDTERPPPTQLIEKIKQKIQHNEKYFSLEVFPPKTFNGATNLFAIMCRISESATPLFVDITWKASKDPMSDKCLEPTTLLVAISSRQVNKFNTMIHIPYDGTTKTQVFKHLTRAREFGVCGVRAARRGPGNNNGNHTVMEDGFSSLVDLIRFIKQEFHDEFTIAITGYPSDADDSKSYQQDLGLLKQEVDAGADFITTQMFFKVETFFKFEKDCRRVGINVPIIPGILPIQSFNSLRQLNRTTSIKVPQEIMDTLMPIKDDRDAVYEYGVQQATQMCRELLASNIVQGVHFYTLNIEKPILSILDNLNMIRGAEDSNKFPWQLSDIRGGEDVRPIFWATRPRSYLIRTSEWEDVPNGRWGNSSSASFGELKDYHLFLTEKYKQDDELRSMWGQEIQSIQDVFDVFVCYITGKDNKNGCKVTEIPWGEDELAPETIPLVDKLKHVNRNGILTINSQPRLNGVPSEDPSNGWGKPGGYVFQKAYLEFFTREEIALELFKQLKDCTRVNYHMIRSSGEDVTNANVYSPNAVTWGVFPGSEIIQPTVVDPIAFNYWKDEAFALWKQRWGRLYPEGSRSRTILDEIHDTYYLVNLVDNDYVAGNSLFDILDKVLRTVEETKQQ